ncbi:Serine palmitoyltransferase 1 [Armadillidium vulgare]|nr:Serine palmitoyltransferase 1 [Armadillidium vulgare]
MAFRTIASAIPAFSKNSDIIYADECSNFAIQRGMEASRSKIVYFRHDDMNHLEQLLKEQEILDKKHFTLSKPSLCKLDVPMLNANSLNLFSTKFDFYFLSSVISTHIQRMMKRLNNWDKFKDMKISRKLIRFSDLECLYCDRKESNSANLMRMLQQIVVVEVMNPKKAAVTRKDIYEHWNPICPLPELVRLRAKYKLRLFIDESCSFGTLGPRARGVCDHFGIPYKEVDLIMASLEMGGAVSGGFTVGTAFVVEHQRLSGLGYCFSASLPPMLVAASSQVFSILEKEGGGMVVKLQEVCRSLHKAFSDVCDKVKLMGDEISPVKHLVLKEHLQNREEEENLLREIVSAK